MSVSNEKASKPRILLGSISTAHGIRGEVVLRTYTGDPEAIADYGPLSDEEGKRTFKLKSVRATPKGVIARIDGVNDRNAAEALRGVDLYVDRAKLPKPGDKEYYHADLAGLAVRDASGAEIGWIVTVANFGAGDLLEIRFKDVKQTEYVPFTDACVPEVNVEAGYAVVVLPELVGEPEPASGEGESGGESED